MSYCLLPKNSERKKGSSQVQGWLLVAGIFFLLFCGQKLQAGSFSSRCEWMWGSLRPQGQIQKSLEILEEIPAAEFVSLAQEVRFLYGQKDVFFLNVGRSPFPVTGTLEFLYGSKVGTLPLSYHSRPQGWKKILAQWHHSSKLPPYMASEREILFQSFLDRWMPWNQLQERDIVLVDYAESGDTLFKAYIDLTRALQQRGLPIRVHLLMLKLDLTWQLSVRKDSSGKNIPARMSESNQVAYQMMKLRGDDLQILVLEQASTLGDVLNDSLLKPLAPFQQSFFIQGNKASEEPLPNPAFELFQQHLQLKLRPFVPAGEIP